MKCKAGKNWGKNSYTCSKCGIVQTLQSNDEILKNCSCGSNEFDVELRFRRSNNGFKEKLEEIIRILEVSVFLCEHLNREEFYNVIAVQLRILLCDNRQIIQSKIGRPMLHPHASKVFSETDQYKTLFANELFDREKTPIPLNRWLAQEIAWSNNWEKPMTIREVINAWANKNGGAHVDSSVPEKEIFAITVLGDHYLIEIARYVIELLGYNFNNDIIEYFAKPYDNLLNSWKNND